MGVADVKDETSNVLNMENPLDNIKNDIISHISCEPKAFFKSQQIDDPELTYDEKLKITTEILNKSSSTFLSRFGHFIKLEHLNYFEQMADSCMDDDEQYDIKYHLHEILRWHTNRQTDIKNRRYAAMQIMMKENKYFSDTEMMRREPLLYDQLVGQYLTEKEKKNRDNKDTSSFVNVLLDNIETEQIQELKKQQEIDEIDTQDSKLDTFPESSNSSNDEQNNEQMYPETPQSYRQHWGDFEDEPSTSQPRTTSQPKRKIKDNFITATERDLLRAEFLGIMQSKFLSGNDKEFDYSTIDDNEEYDNDAIKSQDAEDRYFEDDDDSVANVANQDNEMMSSDDELDIYMKNLNENSSVQQL